MIARRDFSMLDRVFFRALVQSGALLLGGEAIILFVLFFVGQHIPRLASRMLPIPLFALLMFTVFLNHVASSEAAYLRAHKREPFLIMATLGGILTGISTLVTARLWGATGVVIGYFFCGGIFYLAGGTYIFVRLRRRWHDSSSDSSSDFQELL